MPTTFPENEVEVLRRYLPDELHAALQRVRAELIRTRVDTIQDPDTVEALDTPLPPDQRQSQARAVEVNDARGRLLAVLDSVSLGQANKPPNIATFDEIVDAVARHELPGALALLGALDPATLSIASPPLDRPTITTAFTDEPIDYLMTRVTKIIQTPQGPKEIRVRDRHVLLGYRASERLDATQVDQLFTLLRFLDTPTEQTFRLTAMRAEAHFGLGAYEDAIREYATLLPDPSPGTGGGDPGPGSGGGQPEVVGPTIVGRTPAIFESVIGATLSEADVTPRGRIVIPPDLLDIVVAGHVLVPTDVLDADAVRDARGKFAAVRSGFARLGQGDALFRRFRRPDDEIRARIRAAYAAAVEVVARHGVAAENPFRQQIERYAAVQTAKLDAGLNFLGYRDSYVPILRPATLQALAERRIDAAAAAVQRFELFKKQADAIQDELQDLDFQRDVKEIELAIADEQIAKAREQVAITGLQIEKIDAQLAPLENSDLLEIGGAMLEAGTFAVLSRPAGEFALSLGTNLPGVLGALSGLGSMIASYNARKDDLRFQKQIAEKERDIAQRDVTIAQLSKEIIEVTADFLGERVRRIQNRELNADLYYATAEAFRAIALRHLDAAILWSYLFERAVSFLSMETDLQKIQLDYSRGPGGLLAAPDALRADLIEVDDLNVPITKFQFLTETYALRFLYPLEFNRFLQTGRMDFAMSLYELNKRRPGVYRQRIKRVQVELPSAPATGFTGRIRHRGSFLLRDKETTPEPGAGPFIPSGERLEQAFAALGAGATQGVSIDGVMPFLLDVDTIELSPNQPPPDLGEAATETLAPIEGYGPAGDWTLEIENVDLRAITDVKLHITYVIPESDEPLAERVRGLIAAYERELLEQDDLDLITPFRLRDNRFRDVFAQLENGEARLTLVRNDFPAGITDLKLKTIVAQVVDPSGKGLSGVALELSKPGTTFRLERSTRADGFSEDLSAEIPFLPPADRPDVEGSYTLRLVDPGQFGAIGDLVLLFVYAFREV